MPQPFTTPITASVKKMSYRFDDVIYGHMVVSKQFANLSLLKRFKLNLTTLVVRWTFNRNSGV